MVSQMLAPLALLMPESRPAPRLFLRGSSLQREPSILNISRTLFLSVVVLQIVGIGRFVMQFDTQSRHYRHVRRTRHLALDYALGWLRLHPFGNR